MSEFIQLHLLTSYAPANLNRDDLGRPKTAKVGGTDRLRISSQSLKRAWRKSEVFESACAGHIGERTRNFAVVIYDRLREKNVEEKKARDWAKKIVSPFGDSFKKDKENDPLADLKIEQLVHISPEERESALHLADICAGEDREPTKDELDLLREKTQAVDIALFGRMLASSPEFNVEAAVQVAHAITINKIVVEDDYFTAVDDLNVADEHSGSAHINETGFGSGVFYIYICINKDLLIDNLSGNRELAGRALRAMVEAAMTVSPSGKQNSFASRARAQYVLVEKGKQQPRQLTSAFLRPVSERDAYQEDADLVSVGIQRIKTLRDNMNEAYDPCSDIAKEMIVTLTQQTGSLQEILKFLGD